MSVEADLLSAFAYDPDTGMFSSRSTGVRVGSKLPVGYRYLTLKGRKFLEHRVAWLFMTGMWPPEQIDHINLVKADNRWSNLRSATRRQNQTNRRVRTDNQHGWKGVYWHHAAKKWAAKVYLPEQKRVHLGVFECPAAAHFAYVIGAAKLYGEFARAR